MAKVNKKAASPLVPAQFKVAEALRSGFKRKAKADGFNSQIVMRLLMQKYIDGEIKV